MLTILSVITGVKDYVEIVHKLVESESTNQINNYVDIGAIATYLILGGKQLFSDIINFTWLKNVGSLPVLIPEVASAMISEISVLDGYFHNAFTFLESPISYGDNNYVVFCLEKFTIGMINSLFLCLPTSTAHIITLRRFVMQGLDAGYIAGLGTITGNIVWIGSIVLGLRFVVIPWLSLDIFRYLLGFTLLIKYMWDSYSERRTILEDVSKSKIFLLNFLLAFTEQTNIYPFISNLSIGSDSTILESFPADNMFQFIAIHFFYLLGMVVGSVSLLKLTYWFWENPAFNLYMWIISSLKVTTGVYYKFLNFFFLYLTMICSISSIAYFGLDYTVTHPLGLTHEDRLIDQKILFETSFLNTKASDRNTRRNRGRHGRRERWKRRVRRYRTFDASLYDQGVYDLFTIEDLNYGFDRFWYRRKIRNHRVRFRFFPGPWMRSFKKQLARPRLESFMGPRVEFFRILFEQVYHPEFHEFQKKQKFTDIKDNKQLASQSLSLALANDTNNQLISVYLDKPSKEQKQNFKKEFSTLRKFVRKLNNRMKMSKILFQTKNNNLKESHLMNSVKPIYSKKWKQIFSKLSQPLNSPPNDNLFKGFYNQILTENSQSKIWGSNFENNYKKNQMEEKLSKKDRQILRYKTFLIEANSQVNFSNSDNKHQKSNNKPIEIETLSSEKSLNMPYTKMPNEWNSKNVQINTKVPSKEQLNSETSNFYKSLTLFHPIKFYLQKEQAFVRKWKFYGANVFRNFGVENQAPYFRIMMKRFFYYYKPTLRWERTMRTATMRKARRKGTRIPRKLNVSKKIQGLSQLEFQSSNFENSELIFPNKITENYDQIQKPTHFYSLVSKRASRYRYQIYKDVLQHWYYSPFNRFLLKFDVDSFIRRQPFSHFQTKNEENLLNLRRFLLYEYYNTLRWYTFMEHYSSMKAHIGGTKSLASRLYNQQFQGTFHKVRHLFAITPSSTENTILRFDQPLYNEFSNKNNVSILEDSMIHEELLADDDLYMESKWIKNKESQLAENSSLTKFPADDLTAQSTKVIREYLWKSAPIRQNFVKNLISEKNYWELTKFLYKGKKTRGSNATTNEKSFLLQEKNALFTKSETKEFDDKQRKKFQEFINEKFTENQSANFFQQDLWFQLIQKCQNQLYNQESLKFYLSRHVEKRQRQKQRQEKYLKLRLERMKNWLWIQSSNSLKESSISSKTKSSEIVQKQFNTQKNRKTNISGLTTAIEKSLKEGIYYQKNWIGPWVKSNIRNNRMPIKWTNFSEKNKSMNLKKNLQNRLKLHQLQTIQVEKDFQNKLSSVNQTNSSLLGNSFASASSLATQGKTASFSFDLPSKQTLAEAKTKEAKEETKAKEINENTAKRIYEQINLQKLFFSLKNTFTPFVFVSKKMYSNIIDKPVSLFKNAWIQTPEKDLNVWRQQENILTKRKKMRKTLKRLRNTNNRDLKAWKLDDLLLFNSPNESNIPLNSNNILRKKTDSNQNISTLNKQRSIESWEQWRKKSTQSSSTLFERKNFQIHEFFHKVITKNFQRKRSRLRRYRRLKGRGPIQKRTLGEKLKRQFRLLKKYGRMSDSEAKLRSPNTDKGEKLDKKVEIFQIITKRKYEPKSEFTLRSNKQRRTRQRKHRFWKKHKKQKYAQNKRKQRKRRRYAVGKIRVLNKELKRIKATLAVQKWWWETFLPTVKANKEVIWQNEINNQLKTKFNELSISDILTRDKEVMKNYVEKIQGEKTLQIGNYDFKPLSTPEAILIREKLTQQNKAMFANKNSKASSLSFLKNDSSNNSSNNSSNDFSNQKAETFQKSSPSNFQTSNINSNYNSKEVIQKDLQKQNQTDIFGKISQNLLVSSTQEKANFQKNHSSFLIGINPMPFYAGWDESLRKFVITNRLLSNKEAGYLFKFSHLNLLNEKDTKWHYKICTHNLKPLCKIQNGTNLAFSQAPLKGMNAATTLYWQIPFTTYDPDQFFALGMDGFSPIGWKKFHFRHSTQTTKPLLVKTKTVSSLAVKKTFQNFQFQIQTKFLENRWKNSLKKNSSNNFLRRQNQKNQYRKIQKRYKRVKKHPRPPVWFPSGPLTNQVLPVHYIYVFYKRYRLPRDRYIRRRLRRNKDGTPLSIRQSMTHITDFTLRRRAKPKRKYHRKTNLRKNDYLFLKRRKFRSFGTLTKSFSTEPFEVSNVERLRPISKNHVTSALVGAEGESSTLEQRLFQNKSKERRKSSQKQSSENVRVRQLRRRIQRQVIRPTWRYRPRSGGFTWPGDYLRLELVRAPKLNIKQLPIMSNKNKTTKQRKVRKKKRRTIQEWQVQPKKYLLQKHNIKVLKKRLEKSMRLNKLSTRAKQMEYFLMSLRSKE